MSSEPLAVSLFLAWQRRALRLCTKQNVLGLQAHCFMHAAAGGPDQNETKCDFYSVARKGSRWQPPLIAFPPGRTRAIALDYHQIRWWPRSDLLAGA